MWVVLWVTVVLWSTHTHKEVKYTPTEKGGGWDLEFGSSKEGFAVRTVHWCIWLAVKAALYL